MLFIEGNLDNLLVIGLFLFLTIVNLYLLKKSKKPYLMLIIVAFTVYFAFNSLALGLPLTPFTQVFFVIFNAIVLVAKVIS